MVEPNKSKWRQSKTQNSWRLVWSCPKFSHLKLFRISDFELRIYCHLAVLTGASTALLCGCQAHYIRDIFFSYDSFTSRPKRDLLLCVARHRAVTLTRNAPLSKAQSPGISVSRIEPFREFPLPVLPVVESFPGAMSPLGSKEPNEPFLSPHKVFVASRPQKSAR